MEECKFSFRIKNYYVQLTKRNVFQIIKDQSGGAKTIVKINMH